MKMEERKKEAGIWLENNGSYGFCDGERTWILGRENVPAVEGLFPERIGDEKQLHGSGETAVMALAYGRDNGAALTRTVEFRPETGSFTVLDEKVAADDGRTITETLYSPYPICVEEGSVRIDADGAQAEVIVRNQENLRVERQESQDDKTAGYFLKWELPKGRAYTCCQVEVKQ